MRQGFDAQMRLDCSSVPNVQLNLDCRDEIVPILAALKHIYGQPEVRDSILDAIAEDVNVTSSANRGRKGMDYWQILVLAAVRLGCNLDYDKLQDLAEQHRVLRQIMGIGDWDQQTTFDWRRIRDNITQVRPETIERINHLIVAEGHRLVPEASQTATAEPTRQSSQWLSTASGRNFHSSTRRPRPSVRTRYSAVICSAKSR